MGHFKFFSLHMPDFFFTLCACSACMLQASERILPHHNCSCLFKSVWQTFEMQCLLSRGEHTSGSVIHSCSSPPRLRAMEGTESTGRERATRKDGSQEANQQVLMSSKPLHRFLQKEPRSLGVTQVVNTYTHTHRERATANCYSTIGTIHPSSPPSQIVIAVFGCAEILMGFHLASEILHNSCAIYIPFWQGALVHSSEILRW